MSFDRKRRRLDLNLTQQQLAHEARCSIAMLRLLEGGFTPSHSEVAARVDAVLKDHEPAASEPVGQAGVGAPNARV
jgi:predicted transcriptional regulator